MANTKLTPKMTDYLETLNSLGGQIDYLDAIAKGIKLNGNIENALVKRKLVTWTTRPETFNSPAGVALTQAGRELMATETKGHPVHPGLMGQVKTYRAKRSGNFSSLRELL